MESLADLDISQPVSEDARAGPWLVREGTYEAVREAQRAERADPPYVPHEKVPDWPLVEDLCSEALMHKTKDLYLALCLFEAVVRNHGASGVLSGLRILTSLHADFFEDFHPQPAEWNPADKRTKEPDFEERYPARNHDRRINHLQRFFERFKDVVSNIVVCDGNPDFTVLQWKHRGKKLPSGAPSTWTDERVAQVVGGTAWEFYDHSVTLLEEAKQQTEKLRVRLLEGYKEQAIGVARLLEPINDALAIFRQLRDDKGPDPRAQRAGQILSSVRCGFVESSWLAAQLANGIPEPRIIQSLTAAVADQAVGTVPSEGWSQCLETLWKQGDAYTQQAGPEVSSDAEPQPKVTTTQVVTTIPPPPPTGGDSSAMIRHGCHELRRREPANAASYLCLRWLRWSELCASPGQVPAASLPAPSATDRQDCEAMREAGDWKNLLERSEVVLADTPCGAAWLDLQLYTLASLRELRHLETRTTVLGALRSFLGMCDWLIDSKLSDGSDAATALTKNWIQKEVLGGVVAAPSAGEASGAGGDGSSEFVDQVVHNAREQLRSNGFEAATQMLGEAARQAESQRERFVLQSELADICVANSKPEVGMVILEGLADEVRERRLEHWERRDFVTRPLATLMQQYDKLSKSGSVPEGLEARRRALLQDLVRIDPTRLIGTGSMTDRGGK